jgi:predicted MFS family arabinose efflux permease
MSRGHVPAGGEEGQPASVRAELAALRSGRLWLALAACAFTTGVVLVAYSYISPLLTGRSGISSGLVPLVLAGFGLGSFAGSLLAGRLGDARPHAVTIAAPVATTLILMAICLFAAAAVPTAILIAFLGLFGLGANPVLVSLAVRFAGRAPILGSSLSVSAFNLGTAAATGIGDIALQSRLGVTGPAVVGTVIAALTLIPVTALALAQRSRAADAAPLNREGTA